MALTILVYHLNDTLGTRERASSRDGLVLLAEPEGKKSSTGDLYDLKTHTRKITDGVARTSKTGHKNLVVLVDKTHATIAGYVCCDSLVVFTELHTDAFTNGRVRLLGFNTNLLDDDSSSV